MSMMVAAGMTEEDLDLSSDEAVDDAGSVDDEDSDDDGVVDTSHCSVDEDEDQ